MPIPRALTPDEARRTLAARLASRADRLRQLSTRLGLRPWRVFLTWVRYGGEERGEGDESVVARRELLPTPRVSDLTSLSLAQFDGGVLPVGTIRVDQISATMREDELTGRVMPASDTGDPIEQPTDFFWELEHDHRNDPGGTNRPAERYRLIGRPYLDAGAVQYAVLLERVSADRGFEAP